jgi:hypothetical protein
MTNTSIDQDRSPDHIGELTLRRLRTGEFDDERANEIRARIANDTRLQQMLASIEEEETAFQTEISLERFAGGVERAARTKPRQTTRRTVWLAAVSTVGLAAAAGLALFVLPAQQGFNRVKGSAENLVVRIAPKTGLQREATTHETVSADDSLRLGYSCNLSVAPEGCKGTRYLVAAAIDDTGTISMIYPEIGQGIAIEASNEVRYLPDSFSFTGTGRERLVVVLADEPITADAVRASLLAAFSTAAGNLQSPALADFHSGEARVQTYLFLKTP